MCLVSFFFLLPVCVLAVFWCLVCDRLVCIKVLWFWKQQRNKVHIIFSHLDHLGVSLSPGLSIFLGRLIFFSLSKCQFTSIPWCLLYFYGPGAMKTSLMVLSFVVVLGFGLQCCWPSFAQHPALGNSFQLHSCHLADYECVIKTMCALYKIHLF